MFSNELRDFVVDCGFNYKQNGTTAKLPVTIELINNTNMFKKTYNVTVDIEDKWSSYGSNTLCINGAEIKKKLGHEMFSSTFNTFNYENNILSFIVNDYKVLLYSRY